MSLAVVGVFGPLVWGEDTGEQPLVHTHIIGGIVGTEFCSTGSDRVTVKYVSLVRYTEPRYVHQITDHLTLDVDVKLGVGMQTG